MTRQEEFDVIKNLIKENFKCGACGLFNTRNTEFDRMDTLFEGEYFTLDICYHWEYFEVFGLSYNEFVELSDYYDKLGW